MSWKKNNYKQILEIFFSALDFYFGFRWFCFNFSITDLKHQKWIGRYFLMHYNSQPTLQGRLLRSKIHSIETVGTGRVRGPGIWQISWAYLNQREQIMPTTIHEYLPSRFSDFPTARPWVVHTLILSMLLSSFKSKVTFLTNHLVCLGIFTK